MRSIRWKIVLTSLLLVSIPILVLNRHAIYFFDRFTRTALEQHLRSHAFLVGAQYKQTLDTPDPEIRDYLRQQLAADLREYELEMDARFQILSPAGLVLFDSRRHGAEGSFLVDRPEIAEALTGAYSARARLSADSQYMYYYIARPVKNAAKDTLGIVYIIRHTGPIIAAIQQMVTNQRTATYVSVLAAALIATLMALTLTRRLRALTRGARDFATGKAEFDIDFHGGDEIAELAASVKTMAHEIEARNTYNRDFISTTLHELKAPLTAIKGAAELLDEGAVDDPTARAKFLGNIRYQADRMIRMTGELTEMTRLDIELLRGKREHVEYVQFINDVVERLEPTFHDDHAALSCGLPPAGIAAMIAPGRIEQVISNLLENALRYTPVDGRVTIEVETTPDDQLLTHVTDTGPGISPTNIARVFDRFFTTEQRDGSVEYGSGLGLAIARAIVSNHGGEITVQSPWPADATGGTRFTFTLPWA